MLACSLAVFANWESDACRNLRILNRRLFPGLSTIGGLNGRPSAEPSLASLKETTESRNWERGWKACGP